MMGDLIALASSLVFASAGLYFFIQKEDFGILPFLFFGACTIILAIPTVMKIRRAKRTNNQTEDPGVVLKEGSHYRVDVTERDVTLTDLTSDSRDTMDWDAITEVFVIAIDDVPIGRVSYVLHQDERILEIPMDVEGNEEFLKQMQAKLPRFDNEALIEAMGMLHGYKRLFSKNA